MGYHHHWSFFNSYNKKLLRWKCRKAKKVHSHQKIHPVYLNVNKGNGLGVSYRCALIFKHLWIAHLHWKLQLCLHWVTRYILHAFEALVASHPKIIRVEATPSNHPIGNKNSSWRILTPLPVYLPQMNLRLLSQIQTQLPNWNWCPIVISTHAWNILRCLSYYPLD